MHIYVTNNERIFRVSLSSRIKMAFLLRNPLCANSKDTSGAGDSTQLFATRGIIKIRNKVPEYRSGICEVVHKNLGS